ncbi:type II toxin-antitoxin system RelE/ParE family toxin [Epilithonimonas caeni]|uniref:type II toxin-antitoxin system RelE/ParE family toxin n=1 Tax=Epilithonimonas caeni TaxID=365343 RepID=UPI000414E901|nr:type II toxin-antitoxin system RelE/ParE family toxin [Epilithonimonas caeni]
MRIRYTKEAEESLIEIAEFLYYRWTENEIRDLYAELETVLENVSQNLVVYEKFSENIFQALIGNRNVKFYFSVNQDEILVLFFLNCRQNPDRLDFLK